MATIQSGWNTIAVQRVLKGRAKRAPAPGLGSLSPSTIPSPGPSLVMVATGTNLNAATKIIWNGHPEPTVYISPTQVSTRVLPDTVSQAQPFPVTIPVRLDNAGKQSAGLNFTFTDAIP